MKLAVVCVLRSGGIYDASWVQRLHAGVQRHLRVPFTFFCLTDLKVRHPAIEVLPLPSGWRGWWAKMAMYEPGLFTGWRVLYFDLDTAIVGGLESFAEYAGPRAMLRDFYKPATVATGMLLWAGDSMAHVHEAFQRLGPERVMRQFTKRSDYFTQQHVRSAHRIQDEWPGQVLSYKLHVRRQRQRPPDARVVCFHGRPRLSDLDATHWVRQAWEGRHA